VPRPTSSRITNDRGVAWWRMLAVSVISTMKVDSPLASMSEAPTHETAGMRHQGDQGALPEVGRFATHVGSCKEHDLARLRVELAVVGDERWVLLQLLEHRVATLVDRDARLLGHNRTAVVPAPGAVGKCREDIELCDCGGGGGDSLGVARELLDKSKIQLAITGRCQLLGRQNARLQVLELGRDEALGVGQRLASVVVIRYSVEFRFADLDKVAKDLVVLDLERTDSCAFAFGGLDTG